MPMRTVSYSVNHRLPSGPAVMASGALGMANSLTVTPEASAGEQVFMALINETTVRLRLGSDTSVPVETWKRCDVTS